MKQTQIESLIKPGFHLVAYVTFCFLMKLGGNTIKKTDVQGMELEVPEWASKYGLLYDVSVSFYCVTKPPKNVLT